jgi:glutamine cyclotransferase
MLETSTGVTHKVGDLTEARLKELEGEGHFIVTTEDPVKMPDGNYYRKFLVKKSEMEANQLPEYVLPYSEGGHRVYTDKFFVKQAKYVTTADGVKRLDKPQVFVTGSTKADVAEWASTMEQARLAVRDGKDAAYLDQSVFKGKAWAAYW